MIVIDTNVFISAFSPDEQHHTISRRWLGSELRAETEIVLPILALAEIGGGMARRSNKGLLARRFLNRFRQIHNLRIEPIDTVIGSIAMDLAIDLRLRGADAVFVALAYQLSIPLVTWDKEVLTRAANTITGLQPAV